jgi:hypothetical protein
MDPLQPGDGQLKVVSTCPKCGFRQDGGVECGRCGIVFAKYQMRRDELPVAVPVSGQEAPRSGLRGYLRTFRWFALALSLVLAYLLIQPAAAPMIATSSEAAERAEAKLLRFQRAIRDGRQRQVELNEVELNSWLKPRLDLVRESPTDPPPGYMTPISTAGTTDALSESAIEEVRASITDVQFDLHEDLILAYLRFRLYGKDMSFQLEGRLKLDDGYLRLEPVSGKIGLLPIPSYTLRSAARRIFESAENRERFRVPEYVDDIRVEDGQLLIVHRAERN